MKYNEKEIENTLGKIKQKSIDSSKNINLIPIINDKIKIKHTINIDKLFADLKGMTDDEEFHNYWGDICGLISSDYHNISKETSEIEIMEYGGSGTGFTMYLYEYTTFTAKFKYATLWQYDDVMMSISPMELMSHINPIKWSKGRVLIAGLGLGMLLNQILNKPEVIEVHVVDNNEDVIQMYKETFQIHPKLTIHQSDIFNFTSDIKFDYFYIDIWETRRYEIFKKEYRRLIKLKENNQIKFDNMSFWGVEEAIWFEFIEKGYQGIGIESISGLIEELDMDWAKEDIIKLINLIIFR